MPRGTEAKKVVMNKLIEAFGDDYVATVDGKVYVWANDGGEKVQICLAMTCPKNMVALDGAKPAPVVAPAALDFSSGWDFEAMSETKPVQEKKNEVSQQELDNIESMMRALNLL